MKKIFLSIGLLGLGLALSACNLPFNNELNNNAESSIETSVEEVSNTENDETPEEPVKEEPVVNEVVPEPESTKVGNFVISGDRLTVTGGTYEQDGNPDNGKEAIVWKVLADDEDTMLLISDKILDMIPFNSSFSGTDWDNSYIRKWLNEDFFENSFDDEQKSIILEYATTKGVEAVPADPEADPPVEAVEAVLEVTDKVFLLSYEELSLYYPENINTDSEKRSSQVTEYAKENGVWTVSEEGYVLYGFEKDGLSKDIIGGGNWWLRDNGAKPTQAMDVGASGIVRTTGHDVGSIHDGIRPVILIKTR